MPLRMPAPTPRFRGCVMTDAPALRASSAVASLEASSTTTISCTRPAGILATTRPILPASLKAGITMATRDWAAAGRRDAPGSFSTRLLLHEPGAHLCLLRCGGRQAQLTRSFTPPRGQRGMVRQVFDREHCVHYALLSPPTPLVGGHGPRESPLGRHVE